MRKWKRWICGLGLALVLVALAVLLPEIRRNIREGGRASVREAVLHSAVECYTVEGAYPESLEYLIQNYGLTVNQENYMVIYEVYASNQLPDVQVLVLGENQK